MKTKKNIVQIILLFLTISLSAQKNSTNQYHIQHDTTWQAGTIQLFDNVIIDSSATLTINPGAYVEFQGNYYLEVNGLLKAVGTITDSIYFTINDTAGFADTAIIAGGWGGIRFMQREGADTSFFSFCKLQYGKAAIPGLLSGNFEENSGGCMYAYEYSSIVLENSTISFNQAKFRGGGLYLYKCNYIKIAKNHFDNNLTFHDGGGINMDGCTLYSLDNNLFTNNTAYRKYVIPGIGYGESGAGAGIKLSLGVGKVTYNEFYNNKSVGGILYESSFYILLANNIIANNRGIGIMQGSTYCPSVLYTNNTVVNNWGDFEPGIMFWSEDAHFVNNVVWGNESGDYYTYQIYSPDESIKADVSYSCIQYGYEGEGNNEQYPEFSNPSAGAGLNYDGFAADWSLLDNSPCINTGTPDTNGLNLPPYDLAGNPRIYGGRIDMGAYENQVVVGLQPNPLVSADIEIAPNPFNDSFSIHFLPDNKIHRITIRNQAGVTVKKLEQLPISGLLTIDLQDCSPGLYVVIVEYANGTMKMKKLLKV